MVKDEFPESLCVACGRNEEWHANGVDHIFIDSSQVQAMLKEEQSREPIAGFES